MIRETKVAIIAVLAVVFIAISTVIMVLFVPIQGKKNNYKWSETDVFNIEDIDVVNTDSDEMRILQLTDIQLWSIKSDNDEALAQCRELVARVNPDIIVLTGDNVSGITDYYLMDDIIETMDDIGIPWAPVFGNHDEEVKATVNALGDKLLKSKHSLFKKGPNNLYGSGNYVVNLSMNDKIVESLYMFDNGRYHKYPEGKKEVAMSDNQIAWYEWNVKNIEKSLGYNPTSMAFMHFAQVEMRTAIETLAIKSADDRYYVPESLGFGSCAYLPGVSPVNSGFFQKCKELGSTRAMFFGHDHENDASITYQDITMTYGLKSGPSPKPWNDAKRLGGTLITISNGGEMNIRHEVIKTIG